MSEKKAGDTAEGQTRDFPIQSLEKKMFSQRGLRFPVIKELLSQTQGHMTAI